MPSMASASSPPPPASTSSSSPGASKSSRLKSDAAAADTTGDATAASSRHQSVTSSSQLQAPAQAPPVNKVKHIIAELSESFNVNGDEFINENFDLKTFTMAMLKTNALAEHLGKLSQQITTVDKEIKEQVSLHHEDLLHQAINIETLEEMLEIVQTRITSLNSTSERLKVKISTPFNELNMRITQLSRLQAACDTLRHIKGILHHAHKLRAHVAAGPRDIVKSAQALNELEFLLRDFDASGIDIVERDIAFVHKSRREVEEQAQSILERSMLSQDQTQIGTSLQVFFSLSVLTDRLVGALKSNEKNFQKQSAELLDTTNLTLQTTGGSSSLTTSASSVSLHPSASFAGNMDKLSGGAKASDASSSIGSTGGGGGFPGRSTMPNVGSVSQFRAQIWINVEKLMDLLYDSCAQIYCLQQILEKKKDISTSLFYTDDIDLAKIFKGKMYLSNKYESSLDTNTKDNNNLTTTTNDFDTTSSGNDVLISSLTSVTPYDNICSYIDAVSSTSSSSASAAGDSTGGASSGSSRKSIELLYDHWRCLTNVLNSAIVNACNQSNYIKQTFQNEYPKLLKLQNDLWMRLIQLNATIDRYRYTHHVAPHKSSQSTQQSTSGSGTTGSSGSSSGVLSLSSISGGGGSPFQTSYELMRKCFNDLENSYLNRSLSQLFDPITLIFSQSGSSSGTVASVVASSTSSLIASAAGGGSGGGSSNASASEKFVNRADIDNYLKGIQSQLQTLQYDIFNAHAHAAAASSSSSTTATTNTTLTTSHSGAYSSFSDKVVSNICKSIQMYANKAEQVLNGMNNELQQLAYNNSSSSSSSTSGLSGSMAANVGLSGIFAYSSTQSSLIQAKNLDYVNVSNELYEHMSRMFAGERLSAKLHDKLNGALKVIVAFQENALSPYVVAACDCVLAIMLTIHQEDFSPNASSQTYSLYAKELQQVMQRICRDYLQQYTCKTILHPNLLKLGTRCLDLFVRHASLLRPMSDSARQRLLNDSQKIETVVQSLMCNKLTELGASYKHFKAFRSLLVSASPLRPAAPSSLGDELVDETHYASVLAESLPYHVIMHYLFSYAPQDLKSPHQSLNWPIARYSEWLDKHASEKERLMVIKTSLETYVSTVRQKKEKTFAAIYPLMFRMLERGLQSLQQQQQQLQQAAASN